MMMRLMRRSIIGEFTLPLPLQVMGWLATAATAVTVLAMLRRAPLLPSPTRRAVGKVIPGRDGKAGRLIELES